MVSAYSLTDANEFFRQNENQTGHKQIVLIKKWSKISFIWEGTFLEKMVENLILGRNVSGKKWPLIMLIFNIYIKKKQIKRKIKTVELAGWVQGTRRRTSTPPSSSSSQTATGPCRYNTGHPDTVKGTVPRDFLTLDFSVHRTRRDPQATS